MLLVACYYDVCVVYRSFNVVVVCYWLWLFVGFVGVCCSLQFVACWCVLFVGNCVLSGEACRVLSCVVSCCLSCVVVTVCYTFVLSVVCWLLCLSLFVVWW